jgi:hypothetical protein
MDPTIDQPAAATAAVLQLADSVAAAGSASHVLYLDGDGDGPHLDWSVRGSDRVRQVEVGEGGGGPAVLITMTVDELRALHAALTLTLLAETAGAGR